MGLPQNPFEFYPLWRGCNAFYGRFTGFPLADPPPERHDRKPIRRRSRDIAQHVGHSRQLARFHRAPINGVKISSDCRLLVASAAKRIGTVLA
jgi:hypothetical protein